MAEQLAIEISAKDLTSGAFAAVQRSLGEISLAAQSTAKSVGEIGAQAEKGFGSMPVKVGAAAGAVEGMIKIAGRAVEQLRAYHEETRKSVAAIADQAEGLQLTTAQFQALTFAAGQNGIGQDKASSAWSRLSARIGEAAGGNKGAIESFDRLGVKLLDSEGRLRGTASIIPEVAEAILRMTNADERAAAAKDMLGVSGSRLIPLLSQLAGGMDVLERRARAAGVVVSDEIVQAANKLETQSATTALAVRALYAEIGMPIEMSALQAVDSLLKGMLVNLKSMREQRELSEQGMLPEADMKMLQERADYWNKRAAVERNNARTQAMAEKANQALVNATSGAGNVEDLKQRAAIAKEQFAVQLLVSGSFPQEAPAPSGASNPTPSGGKSGGGGGDRRDRIGEAIAQLQGETKAAQDALARMLAGASVPLKELERSVELEKKIADEIAKLGRYDPRDPRVAQIREQVIAHENAEAALKKYATAARDAESIEKNVGDGRAFLAAETERLNAALDTGRLSYEAYTVAMRDAAEKAEDMRLKLEGQRGGVEGLVAGMQYAANQWARANRPFETGQRLMTDGFNLLRSTTDEWSRSGVLDVQKFEQAFLNMLINVGFALAQSELMKLLGGTSAGGGGAAGGLLSGLISGIAGLFGGGSSAGGSAVSSPGMDIGFSDWFSGLRFAAGGDPPVGRLSIVGENGPELFLPRTAGTILPNAALSGGGAPVIHQTMYFGSDVNQATLRSWGERVKADTMAAIVADRRAGGVTKRVFS